MLRNGQNQAQREHDMVLVPREAVDRDVTRVTVYPNAVCIGAATAPVLWGNDGPLAGPVHHPRWRNVANFAEVGRTIEKNAPWESRNTATRPTGRSNDATMTDAPCAFATLRVLSRSVTAKYTCQWFSAVDMRGGVEPATSTPSTVK